MALVVRIAADRPAADRSRARTGRRGCRRDAKPGGRRGCGGHRRRRDAAGGRLGAARAAAAAVGAYLAGEPPQRTGTRGFDPLPGQSNGRDPAAGCAVEGVADFTWDPRHDRRRLRPHGARRREEVRASAAAADRVRLRAGEHRDVEPHRRHEDLYDAGIQTEILPLLIFVGVGAMIDFSPLLSQPKMVLLGAAGQIGIYGTLLAGRPARLSAEPGGLDRRHRRHRRADRHLVSTKLAPELLGRLPSPRIRT